MTLTASLCGTSPSERPTMTTPPQPMIRRVGAELDVWVDAPTTLEFQIVVAPHPGAEVTESLSYTFNGNPIEAMEISGDHGNRIHKFDAEVGNVHAVYSATIVGRA